MSVTKRVWQGAQDLYLKSSRLANGEDVECGNGFYAQLMYLLAMGQAFNLSLLRQDLAAAMRLTRRRVPAQFSGGIMSLLIPVLTMTVGIITVMITLVLFYEFESALPADVVNNSSTYNDISGYFLTGLGILGIGFIVIGGVFTLRVLLQGIGATMR